MFLRMYIQVSLETETKPAFKINDNKPRILKQNKLKKALAKLNMHKTWITTNSQLQKLIKKSTITRPTKALKTGIAEIYQKDTCVGDCVQV